MSLDVRTVSASEFPDWLKALKTGFLKPPVIAAEEAAHRLRHVDLSRVHGVFDGGRIVATYRSFAQELTGVGGAPLAANAVSQVTVSPTHRRRGLLSRMITADLAVAKERGDAVATLIAAEYPIYGRYGFGPATWTAEWAVDVRRAGIDPRWSGPEDGGRIELVDTTEIRKTGPEVHDRLRARQHGVVSRQTRGWDLVTGQVREESYPYTEPFSVLYRSATGETEGMLTYTADDKWGDNKQPLNTATVKDFLALTPAAERALWHYLCSVDWITTVRSGYRAPDDLLPLLLPDPRAAQLITHADMLWVRVLDPVRLLESRTYGASGRLVLELRDGLGLAGGRYRLEAEPGGASCAPATESPDLVMDIAELGTLSLGDESVVRLVALGRVEEAAPGAAALADTLLRTSRRPWCPDVF
ncbi:GNAT family N-acetyltransferase [Streptomyces purpureus]|uniref:GNAT family N-acetyltransferase n=1 Tax=Streptomyces purpureus TaxID=1951 RepID=UPI0037940B07